MDESPSAMAAAYDEEAEATGWHGPEVAFGLAFKSVQPGDSILDLGIGTGLASELFRKAGLKASGLDVDQAMLDACRTKGFTDLVRHDLTVSPYPFTANSYDHAVCTGVLNFISDPSLVFAEAARIIRPGGVFVFVAGERAEDEPPEIVVETEEDGREGSATLYRHSVNQVHGWLEDNGLALVRHLVFTVPLRREPGHWLQVRAYVARKDRQASP